MDKVEVGRKYRHFKGHIIEVIGIAKHSETLEKLVHRSCHNAVYG